MTPKRLLLCSVALTVFVRPVEAFSPPAGTSFTYQGRLKLGEAPVNSTADFEFALWDAATGGNQLGATVATSAIDIADGVFSVTLDFGDGVLTGDARWLEIAVRTPAGAGTYATLTPRQPLTTAPLASALPGMYTLPNATCPNVIGGYGSNIIAPGVVGATIAGGGDAASPNQVSGNYATVAGGYDNAATGAYSFAAGRRAKATAPGAFVWADSTDADFGSFDADTFNVRAKNGTRFLGDNLFEAVRIDNPSGDGLSVESNSRAVIGVVSGTDATAIIGADLEGGIGFWLQGAGVSGFSSGTFGRGVVGIVTDGISPNGAGVEGRYGNTNGGSLNWGLLGLPNDGVLGVQDGGDLAAGAAVRGVSTLNAGTGVIGEANVGLASYGVWGKSTTGYAGWFSGNVNVTGDFSVGGVKNFKIDHPLAPADKYLYHASVESSDVMNLYNGNVVLDGNGEAWVELAAWFEAINTDYRYQLTCVGGFAPVYVAEEISGNQFKIAGGNAGMKVSWQVTGVRQDAWVKAHPMVVEQDKPAQERGYYLTPELYGQPVEKSVEYALKGPPAKRPTSPRVHVIRRDANGNLTEVTAKGDTPAAHQ